MTHTRQTQIKVLHLVFLIFLCYPYHIAQPQRVPVRFDVIKLSSLTIQNYFDAD